MLIGMQSSWLLEKSMWVREMTEEMASGQMLSLFCVRAMEEGKRGRGEEGQGEVVSVCAKYDRIQYVTEEGTTKGQPV